MFFLTIETKDTKTMNRIMRVLFMLVFIAVVFFIFSAILMGSWNYTIPRLMESIVGKNPYESADFGTTYLNISYVTAMVFTILVFVLFGGTYVTTAIVNLLNHRLGRRALELVDETETIFESDSSSRMARGW